MNATPPRRTVLEIGIHYADTVVHEINHHSTPIEDGLPALFTSGFDVGVAFGAAHPELAERVSGHTLDEISREAVAGEIARILEACR